MATTQMEPKWLLQICNIAIKKITEGRLKESEAHSNKLVKRWKLYRHVYEPNGAGLPTGLQTHFYSSKIGLYPEQALLHLRDISEVAITSNADVIVNENEATLIRYLERNDYDWF